jgi:microcystin-dependent protein
VFANFIVAFDTADLPDGWVECDGNNSTPDIQGQFIKGCDEKDLDFGKLGGAGDYSIHKLTLAETYHEHGIPAQSLDRMVKPGKRVSCFWSYSLFDKGGDNYNIIQKTTGPSFASPTPIDLTPKCTSVIFATPLDNTTNFFPVGSIIWMYSLTKPSLSNSDWTIYESDGFFIGRDVTHKLGGTFGNENITLDISNIPNHIHTFKYPFIKVNNNNCEGSDDISCPDGNIFNGQNTHQASQITNANTSSQTPFNILPKYQPLFCIKKINGIKNDIPNGSICAWNSIKNIPKGWSVCDGSNNAPDLTNRFILNEKSDTLDVAGGREQVTLTPDNIPSHTHSYDFTQYNSDFNLCDSDGANTVSGYNSWQDTSINFPNVAMCDTNGNNCITSPSSPTPIKLDPPHIKLIYIMKTN